MNERSASFWDRKHIAKYVGAIVIALLIIFEILICVQYAGLDPGWFRMCVVLFCCVALDFMCVVDIFWVQKLRTRIVLYCFDFVFLLIVCTMTGNSYLSALYCIILSQFYINIDDFKSQLAVYIASCVVFVATFVLGWVLNHVGTSTYDTAVTVFSGCFLGVIIITAHFFVTLFLLRFYKTNLKLTEALKEADDSKAELKEAYEQLSETAVYEERNRIARDIHDNAGHSMTAVIMQTEAAKLLIDTNPEEAKLKIISANIQAKNALEQMRESVHLLAGRRETRSFKEELEEVIAQTMDGTDIKIRCDIEEIETEVEKRRFFVNTLKECLANGMRHGGATAFYVECKHEQGVIALTVSDNGSGLPKDFKEGYGLRGIREKATAFGGGLYLESESDDGLEVRVVLPDTERKIKEDK
jgi:signal transduction histidine kinase